jgi:hypothetical protein
MPLVSRPCNPVNYRAGTGARCKQQERNRLPVKGEIYRRAFVTFLNGLTKSESRRPPNRHITGATTRVFSASTKRKRSGRQGAPCLDAGLSARVPRFRAMKNPARFPGRAFSIPVKDICLCLNPVSLSRFSFRQSFSPASFSSPRRRWLSATGSPSPAARFSSPQPGSEKFPVNFLLFTGRHFFAPASVALPPGGRRAKMRSPDERLRHPGNVAPGLRKRNPGYGYGRI